MSEPKRTLSTDGQEVTQDDINHNADNAALATDRTLAELFRPAPNDAGGGAQTTKGIIPFGFYGSPATGADYGIVAPTGSADGSVLIPPFRALIGSISASTPDVNWRSARSAVFTGSDGTKKTFARQLISSTSGNNRWDLIWAKLKLDFNNLSELRYLRDATTGDVSSFTPVVEKADTVTIGVTQGSEAATPTRPALPSDSGADHYIPLAYVLVVHPHTGTTTVLPGQIQEVAPVIPLSRVTGARTLQPANSQYLTTGTVIANGGDFASGSRPGAFLPSTMVGGEGRLFAFDWDATNKTHPLSAKTLIDDTVDWRRRIFRGEFWSDNGSAGDKFAWGGGNVPGATIIDANHKLVSGQSFFDDGTVITGGTAGGVVAVMSSLALSFTVYVLVDLTDGKLYCVVGGDPSARVFLWLDATGPFSNK